jgi:hypothetical protein
LTWGSNIRLARETKRHHSSSCCFKTSTEHDICLRNLEQQYTQFFGTKNYTRSVQGIRFHHVSTSLRCGSASPILLFCECCVLPIMRVKFLFHVDAGSPSKVGCDKSFMHPWLRLILKIKEDRTRSVIAYPQASHSVRRHRNRDTQANEVKRNMYRLRLTATIPAAPR